MSPFLPRCHIFLVFLGALTMPAGSAVVKPPSSDRFAGLWISEEGDSIQIRFLGHQNYLIDGGSQLSMTTGTLKGAFLEGRARIREKCADAQNELLFRIKSYKVNVLVAEFARSANFNWHRDRFWQRAGTFRQKTRASVIVELPEAVYKVQPEYPEQLRARHVDGTVMTLALVGVDGLVKDVRVMKSIPELDRFAVAAVRQWKFKPAVSSDCKPAATRVTVPVRFSVH